MPEEEESFEDTAALLEALSAIIAVCGERDDLLVVMALNKQGELVAHWQATDLSVA